MNSINLTGRICQQAEPKTTAGNYLVCLFTLAVKRPYSKNTTDFIECEAWKQDADFLVKYSKKGDFIAVSGNLISQKWEDKGGNKRISWRVRCDSVEILSSRQREEEKAEDLAEAFTEVADAATLPF